MPVIPVRIRGKTASAEGAPCIVCGNRDYAVRFRFDTEWDGARQAHFSFFRNGTRHQMTVPFTGDFCVLPALHGITELEIGVSAGGRMTCTPAAVPCVPCITDLPAADRPPRYDLYNALLSAVTGHTSFSRQFALLDADGFAVKDADGSAVTVKG